ncbi:MAG: fructose 1,6-bisphosphatase, partial [Chloroflexota bacterium]|nr:fructose 1,6-bisphosphatase [Chloroflexota bacterium]
MGGDEKVITLSVIKADVGGYVGHSSCHPALIETGQKSLEKAKKEGLLVDYYVTSVGDDLQLIMTHQ